VDRILALGFRTVEVEYRVSENAIPGIEEAVRIGEIRVCSVHNFAPRPAGEEATNSGGDRLSLASPEKVERQEAVRLTKRSIELARTLGAKALVLHMGEVDTGRGYFKELADAVEAQGPMSAEALRLHKHIERARNSRKAPFLNAALESLKDLVGPAREARIKLCVENRHYYHQIPLPDEFVEIMIMLSTPWVRYWHDLGHAHVQEVLGFGSHEDTVKMLRPHLFGMHIHDSSFIQDHRAPGMGEIDFPSILNLAPGGAIKVLELASTVTEAEIRQSMAYLERLGVTI
jgi:sugar phosphate isomerase/epimerase